MEAKVTPDEDTLTEHIATEDKAFHFTDSGLDNVYLVGIRYFTSPSGRVVAEIPALDKLMFLIARHLVFSSTSLHGPEIRFLRKRLGKKANDYARLLRITGETLSRIENEKQSASDQLDALVRMTYLLFCSDPALAEPASHLAEIITTEVRRGQTIFVAKVSANNEWSDVPLTGFTGSSVLHGTSSHQHHP